MSWSPVGNYIAVVDSSTNQLYVYNFTPPATLTLVGSVGGGNTPYAVAWDPSGTFLAVAEYNAPNHLRIYSFSGGAPVFVGSHIIGTGSWGQSVCWDPTGQFIAVAANFRNILQIFSFNGSGNPQPLVNIQPSTSSSSTAWSSDGRFIITTDNFNNSTQIFSFNGINSSNKVGGDVYNGANSNPFSSVWSFDSKFMAVVNNGTDKLQVFSLQQAHSISPIIEKVTTKSAPSSVSCSPNNTDIAVAASNVNELQIFQFQSPTLLTLVGEIATGNDPYSLSWSPDRRFVVVPNYYANTIKIFSFNGSSAPQLVASATGGGKPVWAPCGNFIFSGGQVFLFDGTSSITTVGNNIGGGNGYSWSPNGRFIAIVSGTWGGTMRIFSFNGQSTPTQVASIAVGNQPTKAEWSPDGRFIAVCNAYSDTIQVFSFDGVGTITQIGSNISTGTYPNSASWSPDGRFIAVCNAGANTLQIFSFNGVGTPKKVGQDAFPASGPLDTLWSSNGKFIMIPCHNPNQGTVSEIQIFSFDGFSTPILIKATLPSGPTLNLNDSAWSPDGKFVGITVGD